MFFSLAVVAVVFSEVNGAPSDESCQSLVNVPSCQPWGNCTGLLCSNASFVVYKCQDPVVVQLTTGDYIGFFTERQLQTVVTPSSLIAVSVLRDNSNLYFNATVNGVVVVPDVTVPLNASDCMCRSLQEFAGAVDSAVLPFVCSTNQQCDSIQCLPLLPAVIGVEMTVLPCRDTPAIRVSLTNALGAGNLYSGVFDQSQDVAVSPSLSLNVSIDQRPYSMDIEISFTVPIYGNVPVFRRRTILLDKSRCSFPPSPPPPPPPSPTCQALRAFSTTVSSAVCAVNAACDSLNCAILGLPYIASFKIDPCTQPPSVYLTIEDTSGYVLYSSVITNDTTTIPLSQDVDIVVILRELPNAIGLKVDAMVPVGRITIIPYSVIQIDQSLCDTGPGSGSPVPLPQFPTQCDALNSISASTQSCSTDADCNGVNCTFAGYSTNFRLLQCNIPPAIELTIHDPSGDVIYSQTIDRSQEIQLFAGTSLLVSLNQMVNEIGLQVDIQSPFGSTNLIPYTVIPLNTTNCGPTQATPTSTQLPSPGSTCDALNRIVLIQQGCSTNPACDEIDCSLQSYSAAVAVLPCNSPPAIRLTVNDTTGTTLYSQVLSRSTQVPLLGGAVTFDVTVDQLNNAIGIQVLIRTLVGSGTVIPYTVVPVDTGNCPPTQSPPTVPPPPAATTTCTALNDIASSNPTCSINDDCDSLLCSILGYSTSFKVLPCNSPPAIAVTVNNSDGTPLFDQALSNSQLIPLFGGALTFIITVEQLNNSLGFKMDAVSVLGGHVNIIPYSIIPLNTTNCGPTQVPPTSSLPTTTCEALNIISNIGEGCKIASSCDEIDCVLLGYKTGFIVLPCNNPPAIGLIVNDSNNSTLYYHVISQSQKVTIFGVTTLDITLDHMPNSLGLKVDASLIPGVSATLIPYTVIPVNTSNCGSTAAPPTSPTPTTSTCGALSNIASSNPICSTNDVCDSVTCSVSGWSAIFKVLPCNSPPAIAVAVNSSGGTFYQALSHSQLIPLFGGALTLIITVDQLNGSLGLKVDAVSALGGSVNIIPYTIIPLNTTNCGPTQVPPTSSLPVTTCEALNIISNAGEGCRATSSCDEVDCVLLGFKAGFIVLPCNNPPAIGLIVNDSSNNILVHQVISQSQSVTIFGLTTMEITLQQLPGALGLQVDINVLPGTRVPLIPYTVIPLNTSNCGPTKAPPTTPPPSTTCGALSSIAAVNRACSPTAACDEINCSYLDYTVAMAVLPCSTPPGVRLTVLDPQQTSLYSQFITESQNIPLIAGILSLNVTVDHLNSSIGVKVDISLSPLGPVNVIPYTIIPLNRSNCSSTPTQGPSPDTCNALRSLASAGQTCSATEMCDGVNCQYLNYRIRLQLLPCNVPPSIRLTVADQSSTLIDQVVSQSQQIPLSIFAFFDVSVTQMMNAIGVKVELVSFSFRVTIIPLTIIPISTAGCNSTAQGSPSSSPSLIITQISSKSLAPQVASKSLAPQVASKSLDPSMTPATDSQSAIARRVAIAVPITVILTVLILAVVVIVGVIYWKKVRKTKTNSSMYYALDTHYLKEESIN